jgi:hypothetical protein
MPAGDAADRAIRDLERLSRQLEREAAAYLARLDTARGEATLVSDAANAANAAQVHRQIDELLTSQGLERVRTVAGERAMQEVRAAAGDVAVPAEVGDELQQILDGQTDEVAKLLGEASDEIRVAINRGIASGASLSDLTRAVSDRINASMSRAAAAVDAGVMGAGRLATVRAAEEAMGAGADIVYLYSGPEDSKTRPFCDALVGKALRPSTLSRLRNGQVEPVEVFCGGYNCRHTLAPMTEDMARRRGLEIL